MTDQKQRLSDAEIIATFMAGPMPKRTDDGWWEDVPKAAAAFNSGWWEFTGDPIAAIRPCPLTLDALHEVEARLTDEQWPVYRSLIQDAAPADDWRWSRILLHASAEQKTKSLAEVLRPVVEKESALRTPEDK